MKDYAWRLAKDYPNHKKYMSLRDGVEMEVEGNGSRWSWNVRSVTGAYIERGASGLTSLREAKRAAEGAADGVRALAANAGKRGNVAVYRMDRDPKTDGTLRQIRRDNREFPLDRAVYDRIERLPIGKAITVDFGAGGKTRIERIK